MDLHIPVLLEASLEYLAIRPDGTYVDATFGAGGHSRAILQRLQSGRLIAFDADPLATPRAAAIGDPRFTFVPSNFRELSEALDRLGIDRVDGVLYDLGVSSMQFDEASRGFSFRESAPLDMRMNPEAGVSAYEILMKSSERELADIFFNYGQERAARKIARIIVQRRQSGALPKTTVEFAQMVSGLLHRPGRRERIHPATRVFQALRIAVNDELDALRDGLDLAVDRLRRGAGRVVAISLHSLEDRIVKHAFREDERLEPLTRKPVLPGEAEMQRNPRARSAKLRAAQRKASEMVESNALRTVRAPRDEKPRVTVRTARNATQRRMSRAARARYSSLMQFCAGLAVLLCGVMLYVMLTARLTSLNYAVGKAERDRTALQSQTARLDDELASLRSDDRLARVAAKLHMQDPAQFAMVLLPAPERERAPSRLAFFAGLAGLFGAK